MNRKKIWLLLMILLYLGSGIYHFLNPGFYLKLMPHWLPEQELMNALGGLAEIVLAVLLIFPLTQRFAAWSVQLMLFVFLICIHIPMAMDFRGWYDWIWWISIIRLPVQFWLLRWAWWYTQGKLVYFWKNNPTS
jgi:uncharacterized membrane protein